VHCLITLGGRFTPGGVIDHATNFLRGGGPPGPPPLDPPLDSTEALSRSRCRERRLSKSFVHRMELNTLLLQTSERDGVMLTPGDSGQ